MALSRIDRQVLEDGRASVVVPSDTSASVEEILARYPDFDERAALYFGMYVHFAA